MNLVSEDFNVKHSELCFRDKIAAFPFFHFILIYFFHIFIILQTILKLMMILLQLIRQYLCFKKSDEDLLKANKNYELAPYPLAFIEHGQIRKTK